MFQGFVPGLLIALADCLAVILSTGRFIIHWYPYPSRTSATTLSSPTVLVGVSKDKNCSSARDFDDNSKPERDSILQ
eukprot:scaffold140674_cov16-Prasinocladus_malaysianus.AAC.1